MFLNIQKINIVIYIETFTSHLILIICVVISVATKKYYFAL